MDHTKKDNGSHSVGNAATDKNYEDLTFQDWFIFGKVMKNQQIFKGVLARTLPDLDLTGIEFDIQNEAAIKETVHGRGIRSDVLGKTEDKIMDVEMQVSKESALPYRFRYYGAVIDADNLSEGEDFRKLPFRAVIFLCAYKPYDDEETEIVNTFVYQSKEHPGRYLNDGTVHVIINCTVQETDDEKYRELTALNRYIMTQKIEEGDTLVASIDSNVKMAKNNNAWRKEYMEFREMMANSRNAGREEGRKEGLKEGQKLGDRRRAEIDQIEKAMDFIEFCEQLETPVEEAVAHGKITLEQLQCCRDVRKWLAEHEGMTVEDYVDQNMDIEEMLKQEENNAEADKENN